MPRDNPSPHTTHPPSPPHPPFWQNGMKHAYRATLEYNRCKNNHDCILPCSGSLPHDVCPYSLIDGPNTHTTASACNASATFFLIRNNIQMVTLSVTEIHLYHILKISPQKMAEDLALERLVLWELGSAETCLPSISRKPEQASAIAFSRRWLSKYDGTAITRVCRVCAGTLT